MAKMIAIPSDADAVADELKCPICFCVVLDPTVTPCGHLFCKDCLKEALARSTTCPMCRNTCFSESLKPPQPGTIPFQMWSNIKVKCAKHEEGCTWTGTIVDAHQHVDNCEKQMKEALGRLRTRNEELEHLLSDLPRIVYGNNTSGHNNIVYLTQLVAQNLRHKPPNIDETQIFNALKLTDNSKSEDPDFVRDVRLLLALCTACSWFSEENRCRIQAWLSPIIGGDGRFTSKAPTGMPNHGPLQILVEGAGIPIVNGTYNQAGYFEGACKYSKHVECEDGVYRELVISQFVVRSLQKLWFFSILDANQPGTDADTDFYKNSNPGEGLVPPLEGWHPVEGAGSGPVLRFLQRA